MVHLTTPVNAVGGKIVAEQATIYYELFNQFVDPVLFPLLFKSENCILNRYPCFSRWSVAVEFSLPWNEVFDANEGICAGIDNSVHARAYLNYNFWIPMPDYYHNVDFSGWSGTSLFR